ncbi:long-chain fatty acid--CoA ligase [Massilia sp. B-10]|nr:long-chain fatty acid--CoA ligase [Massilia sp. B-10]
MTDASQALLGAGIGRAGRVAVYLEKRIEAVAACFGASRAGAVFVPVNPLLKGLPGGLHPGRLQCAHPGHLHRTPAPAAAGAG